MDSIKAIVFKVIQEWANNNLESNQNVQEQWNQVVDQKQQSHSAIDEFKNGKLGVKVDSAAWIYQLNSQKNNILKKIQMLNPAVKEIIFKIGKVK